MLTQELGEDKEHNKMSTRKLNEQKQVNMKIQNVHKKRKKSSTTVTLLLQFKQVLEVH